MRNLLKTSALTLASVSCALAVAHAVGKTANTEPIPVARQPVSGAAGWENHSERCRRIRDECIKQCINTLPTNDCGFAFQRCKNNCMECKGCMPMEPAPGEKP